MGKYDRKFSDGYVLPEGSYWDFYNPYFNPESCGLKLIQVIDMPDMSYEYDTIIVVQDNATNAIFMAQDSGCSCPTPFEEFRGLGDMTRIKTIEQYDTFVALHESMWSSSGYPKAEVNEGRRKLKRKGLTTLAQRQAARKALAG